MKILVTGAGGMVGAEVAAIAKAAGEQVLARTHRQLDATNDAQLGAFFMVAKPDAVINCAAMTNVDACQTDPRASHAANALAPELLARHCRESGAILVTVSTDYVFDGEKPDWFYTQKDATNPLSVYAKDKLQGEQLAMAAHNRVVVARSGWIFGRNGRNFVAQVVERGRRGEKLKAFNDSFGTPTYAPDLARRLLELARRDLPGIYHVCNGGEGTSYFGFAKAAFETAHLPIENLEPVSVETVKRPAPRPRNTRLRCLALEATGLKPLRHWTEALPDFVEGQPV
ncbi:MAG: dTDP-4-dehydrorhamnose reductase [Deltaproteobacteria bacterium]|nr:dTDP-4-dehydrorhamnose reductase [Deltaproteobacteria bacterium]